MRGSGWAWPSPAGSPPRTAARSSRRASPAGAAASWSASPAHPLKIEVITSRSRLRCRRINDDRPGWRTAPESRTIATCEALEGPRRRESCAEPSMAGRPTGRAAGPPRGGGNVRRDVPDRPDPTGPGARPGRRGLRAPGRRHGSNPSPLRPSRAGRGPGLCRHDLPGRGSLPAPTDRDVRALPLPRRRFPGDQRKCQRADRRHRRACPRGRRELPRPQGRREPRRRSAPGRADLRGAGDRRSRTPAIPRRHRRPVHPGASPRRPAARVSRRRDRGRPRRPHGRARDDHGGRLPDRAHCAEDQRPDAVASASRL